MRRILLSGIAIVVLTGLFAATGYAGYRLGFAQGAQSTPNGDEIPRPGLRPFDEFGPREMPRHDFGFHREFRRGFGMRGFPMMRFGFFSPFLFVAQILVFALLAALVYWLFTRSGWRLTRTAQTPETPARAVGSEENNQNHPPQD
ncbi:MAG TPA: hypothetical protein VFG81_04170 [Anaerolineales bacterium]|jgi:hypothetical protein|nr:hypothetical protein [Anaerolineales bacterium]